MEITEEQLQEFIELYKQEFGVTLSPAEAQQSALSLLYLMAVPKRPLERLEKSDIMNMPD